MTVLELYEVRELRSQLAREVERQQSLEAAIDGLTATLNGLPHSTTVTSRTERLATLLVDTAEIIRDLNERIIAATITLTEKIFTADLLPDERNVLLLRYVKGLPFNRVADEVHLSRGYMFKVHSTALKKVTCN